MMHPTGSPRRAQRLVDMGHWLRTTDANLEVVQDAPLPQGRGEIVNFRLAEVVSSPALENLTIQTAIASGSTEPTQLNHGFGKFFVPEGSHHAIVTCPGVVADYRGSGPFDVICVSLAWRPIRRQLEALFDRPVEHLGPEVHARCHGDGKLHALIGELWAASRSTDAVEALATDGLTTLLIARLLQLGGAPPPVPGRSARLHPKRYAEVMEFVESRLATRITLDDLAEVGACSRFHFARLFKAQTGLSPLAYVNERRVERAKSVMRREPEWTLAAVAAACGFADQSHLTRCFKKSVGVTPGRWVVEQR